MAILFAVLSTVPTFGTAVVEAAFSEASDCPKLNADTGVKGGRLEAGADGGLLVAEPDMEVWDQGENRLLGISNCRGRVACDPNSPEDVVSELELPKTLLVLNSPEVGGCEALLTDAVSLKICSAGVGTVLENVACRFGMPKTLELA